MNKKKGILNVSFGIVNLIITIGLGLIIPRLTLVNLGSETNGLLSSVNRMLQYAILLEAGVGTVSLQALFGSCGRKDRERTSAIMAATNRYYKRTGIAYFVVVVALSFLYPLLVETSISKMIVALVVFISGLPGVINYFFQGKYRILLRAEGKNYIQTNIGTITSIITSFGKIILLINGFDVVAIVMLNLFVNLVQMVYYFQYIRKNYEWLDLKIKPDFKAIDQNKYALIQEVCSVIFNNIDIVLLSVFCGLKVVSVYSLYALILGYIDTLVGTLNGSIVFVLGQSFENNKKRFKKLFEVFEICNMGITFALFSIGNACIIPFLNIYTRGIDDANYSNALLAFLMVLTYLLSNGRASSNYAISFAKHFQQTQSQAILESVLNIFFSIVFVKMWGIYGVLAGTVVALLYRTNAMIIYSSKKILNRSPIKIYIRWISNFLVFLVLDFIIKKINVSLYSYKDVVLFGIAISCIIIPLYGIVALVVNKNERAEILTYIKKRLSH